MDNDTAGFEIRFVEHEHYLSAHVTGPRDTLDISIAYWSRIADRCAALGTRRLLVVEQLRERSPRGDMRDMVGALVTMGFRDIRIAFADPEEDVGLLLLTEYQAREAGLSGRMFSSVERARGWLLSDVGVGEPAAR